ncbi:MFS transporter [Deinococcus psychrotolerans]|uniref:MFS transporter n=1 Tax=Deinococcus psychrotolerans TaxID=2489213 RepID=A0A3G8YAE0_9DEIO|nr:MFS transporter [Deinococcus psychrotolerans]AZI42358.1 MFS transporter [Deinococcus psychrotolerans]
MTAPHPAQQPLKRNTSFWLWWLGSAQSAVGSSLSSVALALLVLKLSGSAGALGINLALSLLPGLLSPLMGTLIDRLPLKLPLITGNLLRGAFQLTAGGLALRGQISVEVLHVLALLTGLVGAFYAPAGMGVLPRLVAKADLPRATGLMQGTSQSMSLLGLVGGGVLVGAFGSAATLIADGVSFMVMAGLLLLVAFPARLPTTPGTFWDEFIGGLHYVRSSLVLTLLPLLGFFINAMLAPMEMMVAPRMLTLGAGAAGYGLFFGMVVGGEVLGSLAVVALGDRFKPRRISAAALGGVAVLLLLLAFTRTPTQMYTVALGLGAVLAVNNSAISLLFMSWVDSAYFGRVGSLLNMIGTAGMPLSLLLLAPGADHVPFWTMLSASGTVTLLAAAVWHWALSRPQLSSVPGENSSPSK